MKRNRVESYLRGFLLLIILMFTVDAKASPELVLESSVTIQRKDASGWISVESKKFKGISGLQYLIDDGQIYRMVIEVEKPYDLEGTMRVRMVTRSDGVVVPRDQKTGRIILGPHDGCPDNEVRCKPLTIDDVGLVEIRIDVEKAQFTGFSVFTLRPYDEVTPVQIRPSITYKGNNISCGSQVKKGFWIFSPKLVGNSSRVESISICITDPKGKVKCAADGEYQLKKHISKKGDYVFTVFDDRVRKSSCYFEAV